MTAWLANHQFKAKALPLPDISVPHVDSCCGDKLSPGQAKLNGRDVTRLKPAIVF